MPLLKLIGTASLFAALCMCTSSAMADVVVVVSAKSPLTSLNESQIADIFLGRVGAFPSGDEAVPLDLPDDSPLRADFYRDCTGKSASQLRAYWSKLIFTGRAQPPREMADAAAVKRYLQARPSAIAYIDRKDVDASVKVVLSLRP
ncbi:phosphate ABC transporter substrate-binding protein [Caballeronia sp. LP006]|jgi:ABC-type phosphate transport system substrate-binding protein|uniref:phosphate ABC transporter substrate-binding protein n=1 Tax=unclassified Caballeronia TaxID=2646786 RepID=UPI001FD09B6A|nr:MULTISPECIES: phosphate ABC transporter substrate-binding protein [unclassified Caballeronia]MDR5773350.1 phosphate ABC transporter substrate-binding protein [Caballeronia sp. LZ002]MDR5806125.1 phosphate ABC transporter substrate-binding protein [Caballeronia sp. LZ001]MDR5826576.1 phosphate ABC transporter substrate-binding protein [Caballeronia sp. LP006]MDR5848784.1 phosphate ABC transporter substrate-binding protein [Caballeronia sp. LZ003]